MLTDDIEKHQAEKDGCLYYILDDLIRVLGFQRTRKHNSAQRGYEQHRQWSHPRSN